MIAPSDADPCRQSARPRPLIAVLLSLFAPGAGHLYTGRLFKGLTLWLAGTVVAWVALLGGLASTFAGMVVLLVVALTYSVGLAVSAAIDARRAAGTRLGRGRWIAVAGLLVVQMGLGLLPIRSWLPVRAFRVPTGSMEPAIQVGDHLIADMKVWTRREPQRGDLTIYRSPERPETFIVSRVIGLPGERIELRDKRVHIDGGPIDDPWATHLDDRTFSDSRFYPEMIRLRDQFGPLVVPKGTLFLLGDNRDNSNDSRFRGPIARSLLVGRPLYIYWSRDGERIGRSLISR